MSGPGDIGGDASGLEAAWRDLIARFDAPADRTAAGVPWPAREDLPDPAGPAEQRASSGESRASAAEQNASHAEPARPAEAQARTSEPQARTGEARTSEPQARTSEPQARTSEPQARTGEARTGEAQGRTSDSAGPGGHPAGPPADAPAASDQIAGPATSFGVPVDRTRVIRPAGLPRTYTPPEEAEEPYVPVPLPPPAKLDTASKAALAGVIGGPGYLLIASIFLHWTISAGAALVAVAAFIAGFVTLIVKLGDRPGRDGDDDDGAML
jgi:hypothetical protein